MTCFTSSLQGKALADAIIEKFADADGFSDQDGIDLCLTDHQTNALQIALNEEKAWGVIDAQEEKFLVNDGLDEECVKNLKSEGLWKRAEFFAQDALSNSDSRFASQEDFRDRDMASAMQTTKIEVAPRIYEVSINRSTKIEKLALTRVNSLDPDICFRALEILLACPSSDEITDTAIAILRRPDIWRDHIFTAVAILRKAPHTPQVVAAAQWVKDTYPDHEGWRDPMTQAHIFCSDIINGPVVPEPEHMDDDEMLRTISSGDDAGL